MTIEQEWQEVLEKCGFKVFPRGLRQDREPDDYVHPNRYWGKQPPLTLDNLFRWPVTEIRRLGYEYELIGWSTGLHKAIINKLQKGWAETFTTHVDADPRIALTSCLY